MSIRKHYERKKGEKKVSFSLDVEPQKKASKDVEKEESLKLRELGDVKSEVLQEDALKSLANAFVAGMKENVDRGLRLQSARFSNLLSDLIESPAHSFVSENMNSSFYGKRIYKKWY